MISTILISALISLLNTDGLETNSSLLTATWFESLWTLPVFWDWSMTGWRDAYEVRFQIPSEPVNFAKKNSLHVVCPWNPIWQTWGCQGHSRFRTNLWTITTAPGKVSWRSLELKQGKMRKEVPKKGHSLSTKSLSSEFQKYHQNYSEEKRE